MKEVRLKVIDTADSQPIRQIPQRVPFALREEIFWMVHEMLKREVIQESVSPWARSSRPCQKEKCGTTLLHRL